jgi:anionic cell wall polymer biosynthesis LytR-Cps2A-Psr (LCP) family protein
VSIDHYFTLDTAGLARIIDLLAPKGIVFTENTSNNSSVTVDKKINGNELVSVINTGKPEEINAVFSALKKEIKSKQSAEKLVKLAPSILNDAIKSVNTDLGKGQLMELGLSAMMNPITTIESFPFAGQGQKVKANPVNSIVDEKGPLPVIN